MNKGYAMGFISNEIKIESITTKNGETMLKAKFSIACNRKGANSGADFPWFEAIGKNAEILEKWFRKGKGIFVTYHIQTGSYKNKEGKTIYTETKLIDEIEFVPVRKDEENAPVSEQSSEEVQNNTHTEPAPAPDDTFMNIPDDITDSLPFR